MKPCTTCGRPLNRGTTGTNKHSTRCLVCLVATSLKTFRYTPVYAPARRKPK